MNKYNFFVKNKDSFSNGYVFRRVFADQDVCSTNAPAQPSNWFKKLAGAWEVR